MPIAITDDHLALGATAASFLESHKARAANRDLLDEATEALPAVLGRAGPPRLARPPPARGPRGLGLRAARAGRRGRGAGPGRRPRAVRAHRHRRRGHRPRPGPTTQQAALAARPGRRLGDRGRRPRRRPPPRRRRVAHRHGRRCWAAASPRLLVLAWATTSCSSTPSAAGVTVAVPANIDPTPRTARVDARRRGRRRRRGAGRRRAGARSTWPARSRPPRPPAAPATAPRRPPRTPRSASSSAGRSPCSRRSSTTAPTCWSPPSWPPPPRGTPPGPPSGDDADQFELAAAVAATLAVPAARAQRPAQHPGPRRHRLHLGARRPPLPAPGHRPGRRSSTPTRPPPTVTTWPAGASSGPVALDLPPEAEAIRDEVRAEVAAARGPRRRGPHGAPDRDRLRHARTGPSRGARRRRRRAAGHRRGVRGRPASRARSTASPAG